MEPKTISIAKDFSAYPGGRFRDDGDHSGEAFREDILVPALQESDHLIVDLDDTEGFGSSFLNEAFGGLVRQGHFTTEALHDRLSFVSEDTAYEKEIWGYISQPSTSVSIEQ